MAAKRGEVRFPVDSKKQNEYNSKVIDEDALTGILVVLLELRAGVRVYAQAVRLIKLLT